MGIALFGLLLSHVIQQALPLSRLSASDISEPASALQAISNARFNVLTAVPGLQLQAQQAWVDALNLLFRVAAVTSVIAGLAALWLIRPAQPQPEQAQESA